MLANTANGVIEFRRHLSANHNGQVPAGIDAIPGISLSQVSVDHAERNKNYVSLVSKHVLIAAAGLTINTLGDIKRLGWVNVIIASTRRYFYDDGRTVSEVVTGLPTWDGGLGHQSPFYGGDYYSTENDDEQDGAVEVLEERANPNDAGEDVLFNDNPCLPPSYDVREHGGIHLGKSKYPGSGSLMNGVKGIDRYLACLVTVDTQDVHEVVWSVAWGVNFHAKVFFNDLYERPQVLVYPNSLTVVGYHHHHNAANLVNLVLPRQASALSKSYTTVAPARQRRQSF